MFAIAALFPREFLPTALLFSELVHHGTVPDIDDPLLSNPSCYWSIVIAGADRNAPVRQHAKRGQWITTTWRNLRHMTRVTQLAQ